MTQKGYFFTTGGAGDGASTYTQVDLAAAHKVIAACMDEEGVAPAYLNALACTANGANTVRTATGGAMVDGVPYQNDANVDTNIPSAVGGGNTRIDRLVLRTNWDNAVRTTRITRIAGTDAATPTAPAITQTPGTMYDIMLCQVLVDTSGAVTVTDERVFAKPGANTIVTAAITDDAVTAAKIADGAIDAAAKLADDVVTAAKIADGAIDATAKMAADIVDDTIVGNRVPQFYRRQGGSATDWSSPGTTTRTPTTVRIQAGVITVGAGSFTTVTFPTAFSDKPIIQVTLVKATGGVPSNDDQIVIIQSVTATTVDIGHGDSVDRDIHWVAFGPE